MRPPQNPFKMISVYPLKRKGYFDMEIRAPSEARTRNVPQTIFSFQRVSFQRESYQCFQTEHIRSP